MGDKKLKDNAELKELVANLTLMDDDLMSRVFDNNILASELLLRTILGRDDLFVIKARGQEEINNSQVGYRNIILDMHVTDAMDKHYNIEVQRSRSGAHERRARFHSSMLDTRMLEEA